MLLKRYCLHYKNEIKNLFFSLQRTYRQYWFKKVTMTNKVVRDKSRCGECLSDKSRFLKQKPNKKVINNIIKQTC